MTTKRLFPNTYCEPDKDTYITPNQISRLSELGAYTHLDKLTKRVHLLTIDFSEKSQINVYSCEFSKLPKDHAAISVEGSVPHHNLNTKPEDIVYVCEVIDQLPTLNIGTFVLDNYYEAVSMFLKFAENKSKKSGVFVLVPTSFKIADFSLEESSKGWFHFGTLKAFPSTFDPPVIPEGMNEKEFSKIDQKQPVEWWSVTDFNLITRAYSGPGIYMFGRIFVTKELAVESLKVSGEKQKAVWEKYKESTNV